MGQFSWDLGHVIKVSLGLSGDITKRGALSLSDF